VALDILAGFVRLQTRPGIGQLRKACAIVVLCAAYSGCVHLGHRLEQIALPPGAPEVGEILANLAANDQALQNFQATGTFTLISPERPGVDRFRQSTVTFRKPTDLYVVGRKVALPKPLFRLTCVGTEYLIEFPTEKEYYYQLKGERFDSVPFSVSPSDVAREMFFPESWAELTPKRVRMTAFNEALRTATLEILEPGFPRWWVRRRITVKGAPWVVIQSKRFDKYGNLIAVTTKTNYREPLGVRFPAVVDAEFPGEGTQMTFDMRTIKPNVDLDDSVFDIDAIKSKLGRLGHKPVQYRQNE